MAMPYLVQFQQIKKRLQGLTGKSRIEEIKRIQEELPGYNTGPYGKIKQWLREEIEKTKTKSKIKHQDWLGIKKEGIRQFALVGCPSVGKSSLIKKLSGLQTKIAEYAFTTLKPIPGTINVNGAYFQIVDLPGLIEGASEDVGGGRRLIGIIKNCDGIILMYDLTKSFEETEKIKNELKKEEIDKLMIIIGNKVDLPGAEKKLKLLKKRYSKNVVFGVSSLTGEGLDELKEELWDMSKLIRVYPKNADRDKPVILDEGSTIEDFTEKIHKDMLKKFKSARVTGPSAKFPNQTVGLEHILKDEDTVEIITEI